MESGSPPLSYLPSLLTGPELAALKSNSRPVSKEGRKERGGDLLSPSLLPSLLAYRARIGFQYCQFWPMGRELDFSTVNSGPVAEEAEFCAEIE